MTINNYIEKLGILPHPEAFEAYEATFPAKEKLRLPGQLG